MMRDKLITDEIYHIINHGIENRIVFQNKRDYVRFLLTIIECNSADSIERNRYRRINNKKDKNTILNNPLVEIFAIVLMPNHFHIGVKQLKDGGIAKFIQRICGSYAKYFNIKNNRKGPLFIGHYKSIHVKTDSQIRHLITYIHANPLDLIMPSWRIGKIKNTENADKFLKKYQWSSYPLYSGDDGLDLISQIIKPDIAKIFYYKKEDYFEAIRSWSSRYFEGLDLE